MADQKKRRETTDTEPAMVKALRQEVEELREERDRSRKEIEGLKLRIAKLEAESQTPQEKEKEFMLPTEVWAIIAGKINKNDVCSFALVSKQLREAQVLAGRELVTRPYWKEDGGSNADSFTEDWCAYWSRKFSVHRTDTALIKRVLYVTARQGCLQVFEKYWSQGPPEKLSKLWDKETCCWAAYSGHLELVKWLRAKGCPWDTSASCNAARGGHLEVLQWIRAQDPPCPWDEQVCYWAASNGHLDVLRWARRKGCPWGESAPCAAAKNGHLKVLNWLEFITTNGLNGHDKTKRAYTNTRVNWLIKEECPYDKSRCRQAAVEGGEQARKVLEWLDD